MANASTKNPTNISADNALRYAYNVEDKTLGVNGFIVGKKGNRIELEVDGAVEVYKFIDNSGSSPLLLYEITVTYTNSSREVLLSVERTT